MKELVTHPGLRVVPAIMLLSLAMMSCPSRREETPMPDLRPGVLLITIDSLRADFLGCYGNPVVRSPSIDREARRSWQCTRAYTHAPYTVAALASIMTSQFPFQHNAGNVVLATQADTPDAAAIELSDSPLSPTVETWASAMQKRGYQTRAMVGGFTTSAAFSGLNNGFSSFSDDRTGPARPAGELAGMLLRDMAGMRNSPFFVWTHLFDAHFPYNVETPLYQAEDFPSATPIKQLHVSERLTPLVGEKPDAMDWSTAVARYATAITQVDRQVGVILDGLRAAVGSRKVLYILTADHGESLLDSRELFDHGRYLSEATVRVPLLINAGRDVPSGTGIVTSVFRGIDIRPTIDDFLGSSTARSGIVGRSMKAVLSAGQSLETEQTVIDSRIWLEGGSEARSRALIDGIWKYIESTSSSGKQVQLYNLDTDPLENSDLSSQLKEKTQQAAELLASFEQLAIKPDPAAASAASHDEGTKDQLKSLGYLGD